MKKLLPLIAALCLACGVAQVQAKELTPQQQKMGACNKEAAGKKGAERKAFMKECLSAKHEVKQEAKPETQQEKMKSCNKKATGKKGDERKAFMKECLSK